METKSSYIFTQNKCKFCNIGFQDNEKYQKHLLTPYHQKMVNNYEKETLWKPNIHKKSSYYCDICNIDCHKKNAYAIHIESKKHKNIQNGTIICKKNGVFQCEQCNLTFATKQNLQTHNHSLKHLKKIKQIEESEEDNQCLHCGKEYSSRSGLWKHVKTMHKDKNDQEFESGDDEDENDEDKSIKPQKNNVITPELIMLLIQQNKEMQQAMIEMAKNMGSNNNSNNTNNIQNNNNKSFNLNFFLNETCKDAMNMSDFLNRLDVTTYDFEHTGQNGYVEGMCRILENGLNQLEVHERPIHCTDAKRETIYIKDNDKWEIDDEKKTKLTSVIKQVGAKNIKMIPQWCKEHPGWNDGDSKENDRYLKYVFNSMCGGTDEEIYKNYGDIARYISKITVVDKNPQPLAII